MFPLQAPEGEAKLTAYIATDAGFAGARDLVAAVGLISVGADGAITVRPLFSPSKEESVKCAFFYCLQGVAAVDLGQARLVSLCVLVP